MAESFKISLTLPVSAERIYNAWLNSREHAAFTESSAKISAKTGGKFSIWDDYITGTTTELQPYTKIVQAWRTTEFPEGSGDSILEITLEESDGKTRLTLYHHHIPDGQADMYKQGWKDYYFTPMKKYFQVKS